MKKKKVEVQEKLTPEELENIQMDEMPNLEAESSQNPELSIPDPFAAPSEGELNKANLAPELMSEGEPDPATKSDEPMSGRPMTEEEELSSADLSSDPKPRYCEVVGFPVLFENSAAIITKVWGNGLVNLIVFHDGSPVPDLKTSVPYGEGPNTWKEIN